MHYFLLILVKILTISHELNSALNICIFCKGILQDQFSFKIPLLLNQEYTVDITYNVYFPLISNINLTKKLTNLLYAGFIQVILTKRFEVKDAAKICLLAEFSADFSLSYETTARTKVSYVHFSCFRKSVLPQGANFNCPFFSFLRNWDDKEK